MRFFPIQSLPKGRGRSKSPAVTKTFFFFSVFLIKRLATCENFRYNTAKCAVLLHKAI